MVVARSLRLLVAACASLAAALPVSVRDEGIVDIRAGWHLQRRSAPGALSSPLACVLDEWGRAWVLEGPDDRAPFVSIGRDADGDGVYESFRRMTPPIWGATAIEVGAGSLYVSCSEGLLQYELARARLPILTTPRLLRSARASTDSSPTPARLAWTVDGRLLVYGGTRPVLSYFPPGGRWTRVCDRPEPLVAFDYDVDGFGIAQSVDGTLLRVLNGACTAIDSGLESESNVGAGLCAESPFVSPASADPTWLHVAGDGTRIVARSVRREGLRFGVGAARSIVELDPTSSRLVGMFAGPRRTVWLIDQGRDGQEGALWSLEATSESPAAESPPCLAELSSDALQSLATSGGVWARRRARFELASRMGLDLHLRLTERTASAASSEVALRSFWVLLVAGLPAKAWKDATDEGVLAWAALRMLDEGVVDDDWLWSCMQVEGSELLVGVLCRGGLDVIARRAGPNRLERNRILYSLYTQLDHLGWEGMGDPSTLESALDLFAELSSRDPGCFVDFDAEHPQLENPAWMSFLRACAAHGVARGSGAHEGFLRDLVTQFPNCFSGTEMAELVLQALGGRPFVDLDSGLLDHFFDLPGVDGDESQTWSRRLVILLATREQAASAIRGMSDQGDPDPTLDEIDVWALEHWAIPEAVDLLRVIAESAPPDGLGAEARKALARIEGDPGATAEPRNSDRESNREPARR